MSQDLVVQGFLSYPHLFTPRQVNNQGEPKYSCNIIVPQNFDWGPFQAAIAEGWNAKFPGQAMPQNVKQPFDQVTEGPYAGFWQIKASTKQERPPQVVMQNREKVAPHQQGELFPGCVVNAYIRVYGYDTMGQGVAAGLNAIQLVSGDASLPRLDNAKPIEQVFEVIPGGPAATAQNPGANVSPANMGAGGPAGGPAGQPAMAGQPQQGMVDPNAGYQQPAPQQQPVQQQPVQQQQYPTQGPAGGVAPGAPAQGPAGGPAQPWNQ